MDVCTKFPGKIRRSFVLVEWEQDTLFVDGDQDTSEWNINSLKFKIGQPNLCVLQKPYGGQPPSSSANNDRKQTWHQPTDVMSLLLTTTWIRYIRVGI